MRYYGAQYKPLNSDVWVLHSIWQNLDLATKVCEDAERLFYEIEYTRWRPIDLGDFVKPQHVCGSEEFMKMMDQHGDMEKEKAEDRQVAHALTG